MHHPTPESSLSYPAPADLAHSRAVQRLTWRMLGGANWFFWIAGLSMLNSILGLLKIDLHFTLGLWATQFFDAWGSKIGGPGPVFALIFDVTAVGLLLVVGLLARQGQGWIFVLGLGLYLLDTLLLLGWAVPLLRQGAAPEELRAILIGGAIHIYAVYRIFQGWQACQTIDMLAQAVRNNPATPEQFTPPPPPSGPTYIVRY
jgi:hypothetical protein